MTHISLDLWNTLIRPNEKYRQKRAEFFHSKFNKNGFSLDHIAQVISNTGKMMNCVNEFSMEYVSASKMYSFVLSGLGYLGSEFMSTSNTLDEIQNYVGDYLVSVHPPHIYDENTIKVLEYLYSNGVTLSILSNTGFIKGNELERELLKKLEGRNVKFRFMLFSDKVNMSKPHPRLFDLIKDRVSDKKIIHVGDNSYADGNACKNGLFSYIINSNDNTIKDLVKLIGE